MTRTPEEIAREVAAHIATVPASIAADPTALTKHVEAIIAAAIEADRASGAVPVAWRYRWKLDGEWVGWRVADASQAHQSLRDFDEHPLYDRPDPASDERVRTAVVAEREACAQVADARAKSIRATDPSMFDRRDAYAAGSIGALNATLAVAEGIRARSAP